MAHSQRVLVTFSVSLSRIGHCLARSQVATLPPRERRPTDWPGGLRVLDCRAAAYGPRPTSPSRQALLQSPPPPTPSSRTTPLGRGLEQRPVGGKLVRTAQRAGHADGHRPGLLESTAERDSTFACTDHL